MDGAGREDPLRGLAIVLDDSLVRSVALRAAW